MAKIVKLNVMISASTKGLSAGISKAQGMLNKLERSTRKVRASLISAFGGPIGMAVKAAAALTAGVTAAAGALVYLTKQSIDAIGDTNDLAKALGLTYNQLKAFQFAAQQAGVDSGALDAAFSKMADTLGTAFGGDKGAIKAFEQIGLSVDDLKQMDPAQQFEAIANAINRIQDPSVKMAAARDVFGKSGGRLIALFENAGQAIKDAAATLELFGIGINQLNVSKVDGAGDSMAKLKLIFEGIGNQLAVVVSPWITQATNDTIKWIETMGGVGPAMDKGVSLALDSLDAMLTQIEDIELAWMNATKAVNDFYLNIYKRDPNSDVAKKQDALITDRRLAGIPEHRREQARALLEKQGGFTSESPNVAAFNEQKSLDDAYNQRMAEIENRRATGGTLGQRFGQWRQKANTNANMDYLKNNPEAAAQVDNGFGSKAFFDRIIFGQTPGANSNKQGREDPALQVMRNIEANTGKNKIAFAGPN
jgi:hypothetical protein